MYIETGNPLNHMVEFKGSLDQLEEPVSNSFSYTLVRLDGTVVLTETPTLPSGSTTYMISIDGSNLVKQVNSTDYDTVFLKFSYQTETGYKSDKLAFFITPVISYTVSESGVRSVIGCSDLELPDSDIRLFESYLHVKNNIDDSLNLDTLISQGGYVSKLSNDLILYNAAIQAVGSLQLRLLQSHQEDNIVASRFKNLDLDRMVKEFEKRYTSSYLGLSDQLGDLLVAVESVDGFIVFNPTPDVITGE